MFPPVFNFLPSHICFQVASCVLVSICSGPWWHLCFLSWPSIFPRRRLILGDQKDVAYRIRKKYRLISNLTFMFKIVERLVCHQITTYLERHKLLRREQSAYRCGHSTETAVRKLASDINMAADKGEYYLVYSTCR